MLSCRARWGCASTCSFHSDARMEATVGLQMSQPSPLPCLSRSSRSSSARRPWPGDRAPGGCGRSARTAPCPPRPRILQGLLHHLLEQVAAAAAASARFGAALHRRQLVIARLDRGHHGPLLTLWQEQRMALSGSTRGAAAPPASPTSREAAAGAVPPRSGSTAAAAHNRRRPHQDGAEQPPSPSVTSFL